MICDVIVFISTPINEKPQYGNT